MNRRSFLQILGLAPVVVEAAKEIVTTPREPEPTPDPEPSPWLACERIHAGDYVAMDGYYVRPARSVDDCILGVATAGASPGDVVLLITSGKVESYS
jgi:hypothetical protein